MVGPNLRSRRQSNHVLGKENRYLIDQLRPCPTPAYITCNPWGANGYGGVGYGSCCNTGCGC